MGYRARYDKRENVSRTRRMTVLCNILARVAFNFCTSAAPTGHYPARRYMCLYGVKTLKYVATN